MKVNAKVRSPGASQDVGGGMRLVVTGGWLMRRAPPGGSSSEASWGASQLVRARDGGTEASVGPFSDPQEYLADPPPPSVGEACVQGGGGEVTPGGR